MRPLVLAFLFLSALCPMVFAQDAAAPASVSNGPPPAASAGTPSPGTAAGVYQVHTLSNNLVSANISDFQGALISFSLLDCHPILLHQWQIAKLGPANAKTLDTAQPLAVLSNFNPDGGKNNWISGIGLPVAMHDPDPPAWTVTQSAGRLALVNEDAAQGISYRLTYELPKDSPALSSLLTITNHSDKPFSVSPHLFPFNGLHQDNPSSDASYLCVAYNQGGLAGSQTNLGMPVPATAEKSAVDLTIPAPFSTLNYVALKSRFFAALWEPGAVTLSGGDAAKNIAATPAPVRHGESGGPDSAPAAAAAPAPGLSPDDATGIAPTINARAYRVTTALGPEIQAFLKVQYGGANDKPIVITPGQTLSISWRLVITSMRKADLAHLNEVERRVEYTDGYYRFFKVLSNILTYALQWAATVVHNYGLALVVVTFLIKLLLFRTNYKAQASTIKMQKLAPEVKLLQEQYKDDKQKIAQKQMELWKKHGVNPVAGCLPIFLQSPIFIALYQAFSHSADMRGQSFLWINDLTLPDQVYGFSLLGFNLTINPLPLIYIVATVWMSLNQKIPTLDPQQEQTAKMMRWLPVFFGFIFYNMPAGLVLYFTVNAILSTIETKLVRRSLGVK